MLSLYYNVQFRLTQVFLHCIATSQASIKVIQLLYENIVIMVFLKNAQIVDDIILLEFIETLQHAFYIFNQLTQMVLFHVLSQYLHALKTFLLKIYNLRGCHYFFLYPSNLV
jgi:hypothetical protein